MTTSDTSTSGTSSGLSLWKLVLFVTACVLAVYSQVLGHNYVYFDDDAYLLRNPRIPHGLTWDNISWSFTTFAVANWHPLTWLSYFTDTTLWGHDTGLSLLKNVLLHVAGSCLLLVLLLRLKAPTLVALLLSIAWAIHPVNVESVAWVSQRKTVLSTLFWLWALIAYLSYRKQPTRGRYLGITTLFALSLLAKPMGVTFPVVILILDATLLGRPIPWKFWTLENRPSALEHLREKLPWALMTLAACWVTLKAQAAGGAVVAIETLPLEARLANSVYSYAAYITKVLAPTDLALLYTYRPNPVEVALAVAVLLLSGLLCWLRRRSSPELAFGYLYYLVTLIPVIGIVQVGAQSMADRYLYVPLIGPAIALGVFLGRLPMAARAGRWALGASLPLLVLLGLAAHRQVGIWKNSETLFANTLEIVGLNTVLSNNLGVYYLNSGRPEMGLSYFKAAIAAWPSHPFGYSNAALSLLQMNRPREAIPLIEIALTLEPDDLTNKMLRGLAHLREGNSQKAIDHLEVALKDFPKDQPKVLAMGLHFKALAMDALGKKEAITYIQAAATVDPTNPEILNDLGTFLTREGDYEAALKVTKQAVARSPTFSEALFNLGNLLKYQGRLADAEICFREAVRHNPKFTQARLALAAFLLDQARPAEALALLPPGLQTSDAGTTKQAQLLRIHGLKLAGDEEAFESTLSRFEAAHPEDPDLKALRELWERQASEPAPDKAPQD